MIFSKELKSNKKARYSQSLFDDTNDSDDDEDNSQDDDGSDTDDDDGRTGLMFHDLFLTMKMVLEVRVRLFTVNAWLTRSSRR